jgi:ABC-2 type transport system permease protein
VTRFAALRLAFTATRAVGERELTAVVRSRTYWLLTAGVGVVVASIAAVGSGVNTGYVPTVVDLLVPAELLVPVVAFAVSYRVIADDDRRGTLTVLETYPVPSSAYVLGVYLGRLAAVLVTVSVPLILVGGYVAAFADPASPVFATHGGVDSPALYGRFLGSTALLAAAALSVALAASAVSGSPWRALVAGLLGLLAFVAGGDLGLLAAVDAGVVGSNTLSSLLAVSPTSAYRGLVFETVVAVAVERSPGTVAVGPAVAGLIGWTLLGLLVATVAISRR